MVWTSTSPGTRAPCGSDRADLGEVDDGRGLALLRLGDRCAHTVHHRVDAAGTVEEHREQVVQLHTRGPWHLEGLGLVDVQALVEEAVAAHPVAGEAAHPWGDQ